MTPPHVWLVAGTQSLTLPRTHTFTQSWVRGACAQFSPTPEARGAETHGKVCLAPRFTVCRYRGLALSGIQSRHASQVREAWFLLE